MPIDSKQQFYCKKCNKTMNATSFYGTNNLEEYPDGKLDICKKCATMHVDMWNSETYLWLLQKCDVPYVPQIWQKILEQYGRDPKATGLTAIGKYLSRMKIKQYKDYRWKDTEFLQEVENAKIEEAMKRQGYGAAEITMAKEKNMVAVPDGPLEEPQYVEPVYEDYFAVQSGAANDDFDDDLTEEDRTYLRLKWGKSYRPEEWIKLEQLYNEMMDSYDIQGAGHIDTLKLVCKTSLKANQLIDMGDIEGFQKVQKAYDSLMKSGRFTAAQNKADKGEFVDSIGELVMVCEKEGFIPRYYISEPNDKVDETIEDMKRYTRTLINEESNLGELIEAAVQQIQREDAEEEPEDEENNDVISEIERELQDQDFEDYSEFLDNEEASDEDLLRFLVEEGDN